MPRLSANLSYLFNEQPFIERFGAAARAGFRAVEFAFAYDIAAEALAAQVAEHRLECVLINAPPGNLQQGERGIAAPRGRDRSRAPVGAIPLRLSTDRVVEG